jgi:hypothetical protein
MKTTGGYHNILVDAFGLLTLTFNGLLMYSLIANKDSVTDALWLLLLIREIFGAIYFLTVYTRKWFGSTDDATLSGFVVYVYFILLFGFALAELIVMVKDDNAKALKDVTIPLPVFAWFFLVVDWLFVFSIFVMGVFVYNDTVPSFLLYPDNDDAGHGEDGAPMMADV